MKRLWASLFCLAFVFATLAPVTVVVGHTTDPSSVAAPTPPAGHADRDGPAAPDMDPEDCAGEADGAAAGCTIAVIVPFSLVAKACARRLGPWREADASLKRNALAPEPPPPIARS